MLVCLISKPLLFLINHLLVFFATSKIPLKNLREPKIFLRMEFGKWMNLCHLKGNNYLLWVLVLLACVGLLDICLIVFPGRFYGLGTLVNDSLRTRIAVIQGSDYWGDAGEKIKRTGLKPERTLWLILLFLWNLKQRIEEWWRVCLLDCAWQEAGGDKAYWVISES